MHCLRSTCDRQVGSRIQQVAVAAMCMMLISGCASKPTRDAGMATQLTPNFPTAARFGELSPNGTGQAGVSDIRQIAASSADQAVVQSAVIPQLGSSSIDSASLNNTPLLVSLAQGPQPIQSESVPIIESVSVIEGVPVVDMSLRSDIGSADVSALPVFAADQQSGNRPAEFQLFETEWAHRYVIEKGDRLAIKFRSVDELNEEVTVRPDGMISLQLVGDMQAAGLTPEQLHHNLFHAYSSDLKSPELVVIVTSFSGNNIYVGGEVQMPGRFPVMGSMTMLKAIILSGGFKDTADQRKVVLRRNDGSCCIYDVRSIIECKSRDVALQPSDVVYIPKSCIAKVNLFVEQYIDKVLPFSRSFGIFISHNTGLPQAAAGP